MQQQAAALHMAQEIVTQAHAFRRTFDQAGDVGADKALLFGHTHHAQHRGQGGEVVVGDLGLGGADHADEGGLAHVGEADETHVRNDLEFQAQMQVLAGQAGLGKTGNLAGGGGEPGIAPAAAAALGHHHRLGAGEVGHNQAAVSLFQHGAAGHTDDQVFGVAALLPGTAAVFAVGGVVLALVAEVHQGGQVVVRHKDDVAAAAAVAAVRAAGCHEFFTVEADGTVAALACVQPDGSGIDKIAGHGISPL